MQETDESPAAVVATTPRKKARRGFAAMAPEKQRELAAKGGRRSHEVGTGHHWNAAEAKAAGRKGGLSSADRRASARDGSRR